MVYLANATENLILIDRREGSRDLADHIPRSILVDLDFGDASFNGYGPDGQVQIGVERKRIGDLVNSIHSGRLSGHQIPGMLEHYYRSYLIVEGLCRENPNDGEVEVRSGIEWRKITRGKRVIRARDVYLYLTTLEAVTGIIVRRTTGIRGTASQIVWLSEWWGKKWEEHKGHLAFHKTQPPGGYFSPEPPTVLRRIASELPGVGWKRSMSVEKYFGSVSAMVNSTEEQWLEIEGIGKATAKAVIEVLK